MGTYLTDVFYLTVKSTSPMRKIRLGSVQEPENVISSIMAKNCSVFGVKSPSMVTNL